MKTLVLIFLLASTVGAQTRQPFCDRACWTSVVIYSGGSAADWGSSLGQRELNPFMRQSDGMFSPWKGAAIKGGALALTFAAQRKHPRAMFWVRTAAGVADALVAWRNLSIERR